MLNDQNYGGYIVKLILRSFDNLQIYRLKINIHSNELLHKHMDLSFCYFDKSKKMEKL
jgi:hypothetical protein